MEDEAGLQWLEGDCDPLLYQHPPEDVSGLLDTCNVSEDKHFQLHQITKD